MDGQTEEESQFSLLAGEWVMDPVQLSLVTAAVNTLGLSSTLRGKGVGLVIEGVVAKQIFIPTWTARKRKLAHSVFQPRAR